MVNREERGLVRQTWARWMVPVVALALLGLGQSGPSVTAADRHSGASAQDQIVLVVSLSAGRAHPGPGFRAQPHPSRTLPDRTGPVAGPAPTAMTRPGAGRPQAARTPASLPSALAEHIGGRSPPADTAQ
jgi:hypothetical protein